MPRIAIDVLLKHEILDPQGRAVEQALPGLGYAAAHDVRVGKHLELDLDVPDVEVADHVSRMCDGFLTNPVIETYTWRVITVAERADAPRVPAADDPGPAAAGASDDPDV